MKVALLGKKPHKENDDPKPNQYVQANGARPAVHAEIPRWVDVLPM